MLISLREKCRLTIKAPRNIALLGLMGSGKSHVGKSLAAALHYDFVDLDDWIETSENRSIARIFTENGEAWFRDKEAVALRTVLLNSPIVLATGGGTPCYHDNMAFLLQQCTCIYLKPSTALLANRLMTEIPKRPLLHSLKNKTELCELINSLAKKRLVFYEQSQICISFDESSQDDLTVKILDLI